MGLLAYLELCLYKMAHHAPIENLVHSAIRRSASQNMLMWHTFQTLLPGRAPCRDLVRQLYGCQLIGSYTPWNRIIVIALQRAFQLTLICFFAQRIAVKPAEETDHVKQELSLRCVDQRVVGQL
jgi:hypothetical protein